MIHYICKYTPTELFAGFGQTCVVLEEMPQNFDLSDQVAHANLCGFGKSVIQAVMEDKVEELVLVNCCDSIRRVYDIVQSTGKCKYLYLLDLPHDDAECEKQRFAHSLKRLKDSYARYSGRPWDPELFLKSFVQNKAADQPYIGLLGVRISSVLEEMIQENLPLSVRNLTCTGNRDLQMNLTAAPPGSKATAPDLKTAASDPQATPPDHKTADFDPKATPPDHKTADFDPKATPPDLTEEALFAAYADALLSQMPCYRMNRTGQRTELFLDPHLKGIIYHTIKFCDFYGFEYAAMKKQTDLPLLKIETDFTSQSAGQLLTRIQAFAETITGMDELETGNALSAEVREKMKTGTYYVAGIDSGSTSTDVVILDQDGKITSSMIIPTGGGATLSADKSLQLAREAAGIQKEDIIRIVTTGYGRAYIHSGDNSITEITCHARGAHYLNPRVRTVIDIGGQDIKAIHLDEKGGVLNFLMNDKCAAGTGRFLEMMARTLGLSLEEMSVGGLDWKENVVISSMCTVFAESEVVSLVAQNKAVPDIIHGLDVSVASKVGPLVSRVGKEPEFMLTGGVAKNQGVIKALEEKIGAPIYICEEAQICGAIGAALFAYDECQK